ncbi:MAG: OadG family protein [Oscillospiraceae bacterium]|nr:OadG family protein [Oscillospiraceae bacterium]
MEFTIADALNTSITGFIVVLIILALLACIIVILSRVIRIFTDKNNKKSEKVPTVQESSKEAPAEVPQAAEPTTLELYKVDEKMAATIMAIVSHDSGIPLTRLQFKSIKLVEPELETYKTDNKTAAVIMALVSHNSGIPLERLQFKSIKLIENS